MEYQKIINLLDDTTNQPSKFRKRNWVEINKESKGKYGINDVKFKTSMIRSNLCDYSDAYILVKRTITNPNTTAAGAAVNYTNKKVILKNCAPFTDSKAQIINAQVDDAKKIDIVIPMYYLIEYSDAYSKILGSLWQYYRDEPVLGNNKNIIDFHVDNNNSISFKFKQQITAQTKNGDTKDAEIAAPLKYLRNFGRTLEMPLINCEIILQLKWSKKCILVAGTEANQNPEFKITDTKHYVPVVTVSTQNNIKLLKQLEFGFKRTINWNKYLPKITNQAQKRYLNFLIDPSFQE